MPFSSDSMSLKQPQTRRFAFVCLVGLVASVLLTTATPAWAAIYTYENVASPAVNIPEQAGGCATGGGALVRTFTVTDTFSVTSVALGLNVTHTDRGQLRVILQAPNALATQHVFLVGASSGGDQDDNYDILLSTNTEGALDDNSTDLTAEPFFNRLVTDAGANFYSGTANGTTNTWTLFVCDIQTAGAAGQFNRARLILSDNQEGLTAGHVCTSTLSYNWCASGTCDTTAFPAAGDIVAGTGVRLNLGSTITQSYATGVAPYTPSFTRQSDMLGGDAGFYFTGMDINPNDAATRKAALMRSVWNFTSASDTVAVQVSDLTWRALDVDWSNANNSFEDYSRFHGYSAPNSGGSKMPFVQTLAPGAVHQAAGDIVEADAEVAHGAGTGTGTDLDQTASYSRRFLGGVSSVEFDYMAGVQTPDIQYVGIGDPSFCAFDFGDAPDSFGTTLAVSAAAPTGGARHVLGARNIWLGTNRPDGETTVDALSGVALGDDQVLTGLPDDEDGVTLPFSPCPNTTLYTANVVAHNNTGANAYLVGYIDWNRNNSFSGSSPERSTTVVVAPGTASYPVQWSGVPTNCGGTSSVFARFRISSVQVEVESPVGEAPDGEVEDYQIGSSTLPVTIASVETAREGGDISLRFSTASETSNAGFRIWGATAQGKKVLLATVKSESADSFAPRKYVETVAGLGIAAIQIEDVSLFGDNRWHGPYAVGSSFGEEPEADEIDWASIRSANGVTTELDRMRAAELGSDAGDRETGSFNRFTTSSTSGLLLVREEGIHRVTYEQLHAAGIELAGVSAAQIALLDNGVGVPRYIETSGGLFGPGSYIEFVARPVLTLASPVDVYTLRVDPSKAITVSSAKTGRGGLGVSTAFDRHRPDRNYSASSANGDPWYDDRVFSWGAPATLSRTFDLPDFAGGAASLKIRTWGYGDFAGSTPDHHVVVKLNGSEIAQGRFDGANVWEPAVDVSDLVSASGNVLEIDVPGDTGYDFDYIGFEGFDVTYNRATIARNGRFQGTAEGSRTFSIGGLASGEPVAVWKVSGNSLTRDLRQPVSGAVLAAGGPGDVYAASQSALYSPGIAPAVSAKQRSSTAEYLIVTHPSLASATADLVALEQSRGFTTEVVTTDKIFAAYSDHASSAQALKSFIAASQAQGSLQYVLLVGADTSDPYDHLGNGSVSFVPTDYRNFIPRVSFSPTDETLVDRNDDGVGDLPIGRLPVRTPAELEAVVAKLYEWESAIGSGQPSALLTAGLSDGPRALASVNEAYAASLSGWNTVLAQVDDSNTAAVRQQVLDGINAGAHMVSFVGHSSPGQWDLTPILEWQDAATLTNAGLPNLFTAWGCWNSYYVEPTIESLSARLLRQPGAGAAGTIGATTLTTEASHRALGTLFFARVNAGAATVGEAFHGAKVDLKAQGGAADAIYGMTLLGDPAMSLPRP